MARCRRNVDNFLDACRKLGVDDVSICFDSVFGKEYSSYGFVSLSTRCVTAINPGIFVLSRLSFILLLRSLSLSLSIPFVLTFLNRGIIRIA